MKKTKKLTQHQASKIVRNIKEMAWDEESAHATEDDLRDKFIYCVAEGMYEKDEMIELAKIVRSTSELSFTRWCA